MCYKQLKSKIVAPYRKLSHYCILDFMQCSTEKITDKLSLFRAMKTIKCVLVGDYEAGKTNMLISYTTNKYPLEDVETVS